MKVVRYYAEYRSSKSEPMGDGVLGTSGYLDIVESAEEKVSDVDMRAYLQATNEIGRLVQLTRLGALQKIVWREGMAVPNARITPDMVGLSFEEAVALSFRK